MKRNRILLMVTVMTLTIALAAMAQAPGRMGGQGMRGSGQQTLGQRPGGGPQWLATYLGLSEAQIAQWEAIRDAAQAQITPLAQTRRDNVVELQGLLNGTSPDPSAVGAIVIENHGIGAQIRTIHENAEKDFIAILTPDQLTKYNQWLELRKSLPRRGPGGMGQGPGDGPGAGMGFGAGAGFGGGFGAGDGSCPCCED